MKDYLIELAKNIDMGINVIFWTCWIALVLSWVRNVLHTELLSVSFKLWFWVILATSYIFIILWPSAKFWDKF